MPRRSVLVSHFGGVTVRTGTFYSTNMRSVPKGSFERLTNPVTLWQAYHNARRNKRRRMSMAAFELNADRAITRLSHALQAGVYQPKQYKIKVIYDPKKRLICTPSIEDRIIHQALIQTIGPTYEVGFHPQHYACGHNRGPHRAVMHTLKLNRRYTYRVHLDIHRYFLSIDRRILQGIFSRRLRDTKTLSLIKKQLEVGGQAYETPLAIQALNLETQPRPSTNTGLAIGAYLSQWSGALYLNDFDHYITRVLRAPSYLRYMDDFLLFADSKMQLDELQAEATEWLRAQRRLTLNPKKGNIEPTEKPFVYLGYRITHGGIESSRKLERRILENIRKAAKKGPQSLERCIASYKGLVLFGR